ncbi:MAG: hypothetical protein ACI9KE_005891 [Polyangiales bacterium]|jgi:hypothetical protein
MTRVQLGRSAPWLSHPRAKQRTSGKDASVHGVDDSAKKIILEVDGLLHEGQQNGSNSENKGLDSNRVLDTCPKVFTIDVDIEHRLGAPKLDVRPRSLSRQVQSRREAHERRAPRTWRGSNTMS